MYKQYLKAKSNFTHLFIKMIIVSQNHILRKESLEKQY